MTARLSLPQRGALALLEAQPDRRARWWWLLMRVKWATVRSLARRGLVRYRGQWVERTERAP